MLKFPQNFFWGAATSAYQVEGNNVNSDWWQWEREARLREYSHEACRHYWLYEQDFDLVRLLNHNTHRISIEWSRIEPRKGQFSINGLDHYKRVIFSLRQRNIEPVVTLHHFTNPLWFSQLGGWQSKDSVDYFCRYVDKVVRALSDSVCFWLTINEPTVYIYNSYLIGLWPPQRKSFITSRKVLVNLLRAHFKAYHAIHLIYKNKKLSSPSVSFSSNMLAFIPCCKKLKNRLAVYLRDKFFNFAFLNWTIRHRCLDFIGLNYYTRSLVEVKRWKLRNLALDVCENDHHPLKKNSLGWDIYPQGLYSLLKRLKKYNLGVFILENGICTEDDDLRWDFIRQHLESIHQAIQEGVQVLGYIYWSLIDNFEWDKGFGHRFGLIEVDFSNFQRRIRESAKKFSEVCKTNALNKNGTD